MKDRENSGLGYGAIVLDGVGHVGGGVKGASGIQSGGSRNPQDRVTSHLQTSCSGDEQVINIGSA